MSSTSTSSTSTKTWKRPPLIKDPTRRWTLLIGASAYLIWALSSVVFEIDISRLLEGLNRASEFFAAALQPDFITRSHDIWRGFVESLTMTAVATTVGIALSIPLGLGAASNLTPRPVYMTCRAILAVARAFHAIILAVLFVAMFGFGPFAGFVTLVVATIGFLGKLIAEDIESINFDTVEAVDATGASWLQKIDYAVAPQIMPRFIGLSLYRLDINFRESAIIGIVGAGGIGATLTTAFERYEFDSVAAILLLIIGTVYIFEYVSSAIRSKVM